MTDQNWREIEASWQEGSTFLGSTSTGAQVPMGGAGSEWDGALLASPMELILLGLAGCTGVDVVSILKKKRQPPTAFKVKVRARRADDHPRVYTEIQVEYIVWGDNIEPAAVEQAIRLSEEKYCSVGAMLAQTAKIHTSFNVLKPEENIDATNL